MDNIIPSFKNTKIKLQGEKMYKNKTEHFGIPFMSKGETVDAVMEERAARIIDCALFVANHGLSKGLFDDGKYVLRKDDEKSYSLLVYPLPNYSVLGILNYRLFYAKEMIEFKDMRIGHKYYIYASYRLEIDVDPTKFIRNVSMEKKPVNNDNHVYLAEVDLTGAEPVVNENPDNKMYLDEVLAHTKKNENPHGENLIQNTLQINDELTVKESIIYKTIYVTNIFSGAGYATEMKFESRPIFANVMPMEDNAGHIWIKIEGNSVFIYNNGIGGIPFKAEIKLE